MGRIIGHLTYLSSAGFQRKFDRLFTAAGLAVGSDLHKEAIAQTGSMLTEIPFVWMRSDIELKPFIHLTPGATEILHADPSQAVIFLTPHLGCFEIVARAIGMVRPITVLYKPSKQTWINPMLERSRQQPTITAVPADLSGVRALLKAIKRHEAIGILPDQVPTDGDGQWVDFFGLPAYTMNLVEKLAASGNKSGSTIKVAMIISKRLPRGQGWEVDAYWANGPVTTQQLNTLVEAAVRKLPEQYLWGYNRFKPPRPRAADKL
jgi:Kdo2-lipid IVA lauroyltransferase/acyltransferase